MGNSLSTRFGFKSRSEDSTSATTQQGQSESAGERRAPNSTNEWIDDEEIDAIMKKSSDSDKPWTYPHFYLDNNVISIKKPDEIADNIPKPPRIPDEKLLDRIQGSIIGMALGDALGAHVEFRPRSYLLQHPVKDLEGGGTWGLSKGQFTDDTSMALCLANSLVASQGFVPYDQLVRYKWWYRYGYMSSTGKCFDIGAATSQSIQEFEHRQTKFLKQYNILPKDIDHHHEPRSVKKFNVYCSKTGVAGNGALMRLAPVPLFFHKYPKFAVKYSGTSGEITHGDKRAYDACRYYAALIVEAINGKPKKDLLDDEFFSKHTEWFGDDMLHPEVMQVAKGSYKKNGGYDEGIRGKGYIVRALEAALWAFWSDGDSFQKGALEAVNLGDDTDTTSAIYGQLAGAFYGYKKLPSHWVKNVYAKSYLQVLSAWIAFEGDEWKPTESETNDTGICNQNSTQSDEIDSIGPKI